MVDDIPTTILFLSGVSITSIILFVMGTIMNMSGFFSSSFYLTLSGYISLGLSMAITILLMIYEKRDNIRLLIIPVIPFVIMLIISIMMSYLNIVHQHSITHGLISTNFYIFSNITTLFTFIQMYLMFQSVQKNHGKSSMFHIDPLTSSLLYLCGTVSLICYFITYMIVTYYTTDGFSM